MQARSWIGALAMVLLATVSAGPAQSQTGGPISNPERDAAAAAVSAAIARHDLPQAIALERRWAQTHSSDLDFRHLEPFLYLMAGDRVAWEHARGDLLDTWARIRNGAPPPAPPSFTIDMFKAGDDTVIVDQCYESAGRFGVIYRFTVVGEDRRVNSFFAVESPEGDNQIARDMGKTAQVFTLDHFRPGLHETVAMLPGLPAYADLRQRVLAYIARPQPQSASRSGSPALSTEGCETRRHP